MKNLGEPPGGSKMCFFIIFEGGSGSQGCQNQILHKKLFNSHPASPIFDFFLIFYCFLSFQRTQMWLVQMWLVPHPRGPPIFFFDFVLFFRGF